MVAEIIIDKELRDNYVYETFKDDKELFEKFHILKSTEENCVKDTISKIDEFYDNINSSMSYNFYGLKEDGKKIGYFTKCDIKEGKYNEIHNINPELFKKGQFSKEQNSFFGIVRFQESKKDE